MFNVSLPRFIALPLLAVGASLISGCNSVQPTTFNFIVDMPPGFKYKAVVNYITAPGETCTVARKENKADVYNDIWREGYKPSIDIELRRMINNCPLIMRSVRIEVFSVYGKDRDAFGTYLEGFNPGLISGSLAASPRTCQEYYSNEGVNVTSPDHPSCS